MYSSSFLFFHVLFRLFANDTKISVLFGYKFAGLSVRGKSVWFISLRSSKSLRFGAKSSLGISSLFGRFSEISKRPNNIYGTTSGRPHLRLPSRLYVIHETRDLGCVVARLDCTRCTIATSQKSLAITTPSTVIIFFFFYASFIGNSRRYWAILQTEIHSSFTQMNLCFFFIRMYLDIPSHSYEANY